uniref:Uncharacterized protein n=1 Tax=Bionectria ochroleuca TaxID=29856 RepID=A0A0B7K894_BIOOC
MPPTKLPTITLTFLPVPRVANRSDVGVGLCRVGFRTRCELASPHTYNAWRVFGFNVASQITALHTTSLGHGGSPTFEIFLFWFHPFSEIIWTILRV